MGGVQYSQRNWPYHASNEITVYFALTGYSILMGSINLNDTTILDFLLFRVNCFIKIDGKQMFTKVSNLS